MYAGACTSTPAVQGSSLPFTGLRVAQVATVGIALVGAGTLLFLAPRLLTAGWARLPRPRRSTMLVLAALMFAAAVLIPGRAVASTIGDGPCTTVGVVTSPQTADPPAVVPESPLAALLPLTGAGVAAVVIARRRRTQGR
jgi:hypothetical protein